MSERGREALPDVRECAGGLPGCPGVGRRPPRISASGWEDLPGDQEALPGVWEWSEDPPGSLGVVGWSSQMTRSGRKALPDVRE